MVIGDKLKELREAKKLSQGDIEKRTGLLRCYISRVENGHTVPSVDTLEKMARTGSSDVPTLHGRSKIEKPDISFLRSSRQATRNRKPGFAHL
jgi:transcriptional regulator with XRE-family HTH domain